MKKKVHLLVIRLSAMGDVAMTVPLLKMLLEQNPDIEITVVSRPKFKALFKFLPRCRFLAADVDNELKGFKGIWRLSEIIISLKPDYIADLHEVLRTNILDFLLRLRLKVPLVKIEKGRSEKKKLCANVPNKKLYPLKSTFDRYADVFRKLGFDLNLDVPYNPPVPRHSEIAEKILEASAGKISVGIAPFARYPYKTYPKELMEEVIDKLLSESDKLHLYLFGALDDMAQMTAWKEKYPEKISISSTNLNFEQELYLISKMKLMLSMDSANMHLASIFSVPVISLWGPTHPYLGFYGWKQNLDFAVFADFEKFPSLPCSANGSKVHKGAEECMASISPETITGKIFEVLERT